MTNINKLTTSLTKHGAHKIALLLKKFDKDEILNHLTKSVPSVNIETVQARKNLSCNKDNTVPDLWNEAKECGDNAINGLVLIAIIFSHYRLIHAMDISATDEVFTGRINRGDYLDGKEFTNFAHTLDELGYGTEHTKDYIGYNLEKLFHIDNLNILATKLLTLKLDKAGWDHSNSFIDEINNNEFHKVFSITENQLTNWLQTGRLDDSAEEVNIIEDFDFFTEATDNTVSKPFGFTQGHNFRKTGTVSVSGKDTGHSMNLIHNEIQNQLYQKLVQDYGEECVGTEVKTGQGTSIDLVVKTDDFSWFYEIKTANSVKGCIRQAIPQLLEYAYWQLDESLADRLIIVSQHPITQEADNYLNLLQQKFDLPIFYEQFEMGDN